MLQNFGVKVWNVISCLRMRPVAEFGEYSNEASSSIKVGNFLAS